MIVFKHLFAAYRKTYAWFWAVMALMLTGVCLSFEAFGHYSLDDTRVSAWETVSPQAPRWFLFVMALMFVTLNLPVVVAHGITRRTYFRGVILFALASAAFAATMVLIGFGVENLVFHLNGMWEELRVPYPVSTIGEAARVWLELLITFLAYMVSGWLAGMVFYRLRVWVAIVCTPLAAGPLIAVSAAPLGHPEGWELVLTVIATALGVGVGYLLVRGVALRPRKA
jgi:hypothetical protein